MYIALEMYINRDHDKEWKMWENRVAAIENADRNINGVTTRVDIPPIANHTPTLNISWSPEKIRISAEELLEALRNGNPSIEASGGRGSVTIAPWQMISGQEKIVASRVREELLKASV